MRVWKILATFAVGSFLPSASTADDSAQDRSGDDGAARSEKLVRDLVEAHNRERAAARIKLKPLSFDPKLAAAAQAHADDMAANQKMTHDGSDGSTPADRVKRQDYHFQHVGENVAEGYMTVESLMRGWMDSPHHRDNILGDFTQIGVALARDKDGTPYWCADFGTPWERLDPVRARGDLVTALNKERASADLRPLAARSKLTRAAQQIADDFATADTLDRKERSEELLSLLKRVGYRYRRVGEAAPRRANRAPAGLTKTWMDSPTLRAQILGDFTEVGVGYANSRTGKPYWALILGLPQTD